MRQTLALIGLALLTQGGAALAVESSRIGTLDRGSYSCELPGDAASQRGVPVPEEDFNIINGSSYSADGASGIYLRTGDSVTMTSGPRKGNRYELKNKRFLRKLDANGKPTGLRCIRLGGSQS